MSRNLKVEEIEELKRRSDELYKLYEKGTVMDVWKKSGLWKTTTYHWFIKHIKMIWRSEDRDVDFSRNNAENNKNVDYEFIDAAIILLDKGYTITSIYHKYFSKVYKNFRSLATAINKRRDNANL